MPLAYKYLLVLVIFITFFHPTLSESDVCDLQEEECKVLPNNSCKEPLYVQSCKDSCMCRKKDANGVFCYTPIDGKCVPFATYCPPSKSTKPLNDLNKSSTETTESNKSQTETTDSSKSSATTDSTKSPVTSQATGDSPSSSNHINSSASRDKDQIILPESTSTTSAPRSETNRLPVNSSSPFPAYGYALIFGGLIGIVLIYLAYKFCSKVCQDAPDYDHVYHEAHCIRFGVKSNDEAKETPRGHDDDLKSPAIVVYPTNNNPSRKTVVQTSSSFSQTRSINSPTLDSRISIDSRKSIEL